MTDPDFAPFDPPTDFPSTEEPPRDDPLVPPPISDRAIELHTQIAEEMRSRDEFSPEMVEIVRRHLSERHAHMLEQIANMESFLGFLAIEAELAVRIGRLEAFLGIK